VLVPLCLLALGASPAGAQQPQERTVAAIGSATVAVRPADRHDNGSIRTAVRRALSRALPRAVTAARRDATILAAGTGLVLGEVVAVAETPPSPFGGFYDDTNGSFGPGRFCGRTRVSVLRRIDGRRRRVVRTRRVCRFPTQIVSSVTVTYAASPQQ